MTSKNPEQKGQKGGKEELVSIDSLDQLKRELKSENLDTSKDEYFKEKQIKIKIAKSELNKLSEEIKWAWEDQEKILNLLKQFITSKEKTKENSRHWIDTLKSQIESNLNTFGLDGIKKSLDTIESIEENNTVERGFLTNCLLGIIEANWYNFHLENNNIKLDSKWNLAPEIEILINNYINKNKFNAENIKTAILYRTTKFQDFVKSNTNTKWELMVEWNDAKKYYEFLLEKYEIKSIFGISDNDIKNNTKIDKKDKTFLLSYKNNAFENYNLDNKMKQYVSDKNELFQRLKDISTKNDKNPDVNMDSHKVITEKISSMNPNQVAWKLLNNPIGLIGEVLSWSWALAPFVLIAIIWGLFQYPKQILWWLAALWLWKAFWITDSLAKWITNANWSSEWTKLPDVWAKAKEIMKKFTPNTTFKQKTREHVAVKWIDQTKFDELHDSLEHCEEFRNKNIEELEKAFHNKESQNLWMFFNSIKKINWQTGQEFYENNKDNLWKLVSVMLLNKKKWQKTVGELYDNVPEKELEKQPKSGTSEKTDTQEDKREIKHEEIWKLKQKLLQKLNDFRETAKNATSWHDFLSRTKEDIQKDNQKLINARKEVETAVWLIQIHPEWKGELVTINSALLELAKYYAGDLDITNDQYRDYSQSIAYSYFILNWDWVARIKSQPPTEDDVLKKLAWKEVGNLIAKHLRDWKQLWEILSNPKIKWAWWEVYSKCFDSYEKDLSKELKVLNKEHKSWNTILTNEQQGALKLLSSIQWEDWRIDFKKRTCDNILLATKSIWAVWAWIGLYALSPFSWWTTALVWNIALASGLTTLWMMAAWWRRYDLQEWAVEFWINAWTFAVWW